MVNFLKTRIIQPIRAIRLEVAHDWKEILLRAWSIRFIAIATIFSGLEMALPYLNDAIQIPSFVFSFIMFVVVSAAFLSRIIAQKGLEENDAKNDA